MTVDSERLVSFPPVVTARCRVLILGSMPGAESLRLQQYYGHPRNSFWKIIFGLYDETLPAEYSERLRFLTDHRIALWDVMDTCFRRGSADSAIQDAVPHHFDSFFIKYPNITTVFFNGSKAYEFFRKKIGLDEKRHYHKLCSTSPAHAVPLQRKMKEWSAILSVLQGVDHARS